MKKRKYKQYVCDFETTNYEGQKETHVWLWACVPFFSEDVTTGTTIAEFFNHIFTLKSDIQLFFHNLKFDGEFLLSWLLNNKVFSPAYDDSGNKFLHDDEMPTNTYKYLISAEGQFYTITIKQGKRIIYITDSLKILPFAVRDIGNAFETKHQKLEIDYEGEHRDEAPTNQEIEYVKSDVLIVKEVLERFYFGNDDAFSGFSGITVGSCCMSKFKQLWYYPQYRETFPNLYNVPCTIKGCENESIGAFVYSSYRGGWCYVKEDKQEKIQHNGVTLDVNSLYPFCMSSMSGNKYPIGEPLGTFEGAPPDSLLHDDDIYYFIRLRTRFYLKKNYLPFVQKKNSFLYRPNQHLKTSDIYDPRDKCYYPYYITPEGKQEPALMTLTLTKTDYELLREHYDLLNTEYIGGVYFHAESRIFDDYIDMYYEIKNTSKGAKRTLAKLFLNNLYGQMAKNIDSSYKLAYLKDNGAIGYYTILEHMKKPGYIPIGSAITSYARNYTIRAAQANYKYMCYSDTDSVHMCCSPDKLKNVVIDDKALGAWKIENTWDIGYFVRPKTYLEIEGDNYILKCAGMPQRSKDLFIASLTGDIDRAPNNLSVEEAQFLTTKRSIQDFKVGLSVPGKLRPEHIPGGIVLRDTPFVLREAYL